MRVCQIVPSLEERHGGPSKSVRTLAGRLAGLGEAVELLATGEAAPAQVADRAELHCFPRVAPQSLCRSPELQRHLSAGHYDCIHHHALWLLTLRYAHVATRTQEIPLVISPRGMMSGWAYQHHWWRKQIARWLIHPGALAGASGWHATSPEEADDIRKLGFKQPICVSPNGVAIPTAIELAAARVTWHELCPATRDRPVALFYSRFHRKKRVRELIDLWLAAPRGDWLLLIVGVAEEYTAAELTAALQAQGATEKIKVFDGAGQPTPYAVASVFVLPSHSENFGLVIAEALAAEVPALVTDTTPWRGLNHNQGGWCVPWPQFGPTLDLTLSRSREELAAMGRRGKIWMQQDFSWDKAAQLLRDFYRHLPNQHA